MPRHDRSVTVRQIGSYTGTRAVWPNSANEAVSEAVFGSDFRADQAEVSSSAFRICVRIVPWSRGTL